MPVFPLSTRDTTSAQPSETRVPQLVAISIVAIVVTLIVSTARFYTRSRLLKGLGHDDWTLVACLALLYAKCILTLVSTTRGYGRHEWDLVPENRTPLNKEIYASSALTLALNPTIKMVFLFQYRRAFTIPVVQRICLVAMVIVLGFGVGQFIANFFMCQPLSWLWTFDSEPAKCIDFVAFWVAGATFNFVAHAFLAILPIPLLCRMTLPRVQKMLLLAVFGLGAFTCAIALIRLHQIASQIRSEKTPDTMWGATYVTQWTLTEVLCAVICACVPTLRPLLRKWRPLGSASEQSSGRGESYVTWYGRKLEGLPQPRRLPEQVWTIRSDGGAEEGDARGQEWR